MANREHNDFGAETAQTLDRGLAILEEIAGGDHPHGASVTDLATSLNLSRPVVYRLLASLAARDFVVRDDDGRVRLGMALPRLAEAVLPTVRQVAQPVLRRLADEIGTTAHLTIAEAGQARALAVVEPTFSDMHVSYRVGSRHPLDKGAAGRAILASRHGEHGFVCSESELQIGAYGIAAPVPARAGIEGSVGVISMEAFGDEERTGAVVCAAAAELARLLS